MKSIPYIKMGQWEEYVRVASPARPHAHIMKAATDNPPKRGYPPKTAEIRHSGKARIIPFVG
jgi:hypothetical protein